MLKIDRPEELELFTVLARTTRLRDWLEGKLEHELKVLVVNTDNDALRKAQGRAQLLQQMIELLDKAPAASSAKR